jgi:hypothetical protein
MTLNWLTLRIRAICATDINLLAFKGDLHMSKIRATACVLLTVSAMGAKAGTIIDFVDLTEGTLGESAWQPLVIDNTVVAGADFTMTITGKKKNNTGVFQDAYAYLDYNHAGLGVCGSLLSGKTTGKDPGNTANKCNPSSDDNITGGAGDDEELIFVFDKSVVIEKIWLNNTHDPDFEILNPDTLLVDGVATLGPGNGYATGSSYNTLALMASVDNYLGPYSIAAGTEFKIAFDNLSDPTTGQQFYVSGMEVRVVPIPGALVLFGSGLLGLAGIARRRNHA